MPYVFHGTSRYTIDELSFFQKRMFNMEIEEDMATVQNKETMPEYFGDNPLNEYTSNNIIVNVSLFKRLITAYHEQKFSVDVEIKKNLPRRPYSSAGEIYSPVYNVNNFSSFEAPFTEWQYVDAWSNKLIKTPVTFVPEGTVLKWEHYRKSLVEWHKNQKEKIKVYIPYVLTHIKAHYSQKFDQELSRVRGLFSVDFNKKISPTVFNEILTSNKYLMNSYKHKVRQLPPKLRPRINNSLTGYNFTGTGALFLQTLYKIKYGNTKGFPTILNNTYNGYIDISYDVINAIFHFRDRQRSSHTVPTRYFKQGFFQACRCCENIVEFNNQNWISKKYEKQVVFFSEKEIKLRMLERQRKFLENYVTTAKQNVLHYKIPNAFNTPEYTKKTVIFLNAHIDSFGKKEISNLQNGIDEYGINHEEEDKKLFKATSPRVILSGWADEENRKKYLMLCTPCLRMQQALKPKSSLEFTELNILNQLEKQKYRLPVKNGMIVRDRDSIILRHGASPLEILGKRYCLGKGERQVISNELYYDQGIQANKEKDTTLYLGVELEVCPKDNLYKEHLLDRCNMDISAYGLLPFYNETTWVAAGVVDKYLREKRTGIITFDRSTGNGFEIVTLPGTHKWHTEEAWQGFFREDYEDEELKALAPTSFLSGWVNNGQPTKNTFINKAGIRERPTCGMHIHFSRDAITPLQLGKIKFFLNTHTSFINQIAGRTSAIYARPIASKLKDGKLFSEYKEGRTTGLLEADGTRYVALNLNTGKPTFEIRIFRSNVSKLGFMKNIDFAQALIVWCGTAAPANENALTPSAFCAWINEQKGQYKWLHKWLVRNNYLKSVHKFNPKYTKEYDFIDDNEENELTTQLLRRA